MKLKAVKITLYKCIEDTGEFHIDDVTCLLGKNEAGKSAILEALYKLNPIEGGEAEFVETDYPRRYVSTYRERAATEPANVLTTHWELEDADIACVREQLGEVSFTDGRVIIEKGYDNQRRWSVSVNEAPIVQRYLAEAEVDVADRDELDKCDTFMQLAAKLESNPSRGVGCEKLFQRISEDFPEGFRSRVHSILASRLPKFLYFREYDRLPGRVAIADLLKRQQVNQLKFDDRIFLALLDLANSNPEDINGIGRSEQLIMELEAISNRLTAEIFEFWSQNRHLDIQFRFDAARPQDPPPFNTGHVFSTRVYNQRHRATVNFDERSSGFIWFFSFLIWLSQVRKVYGENVLLLLDEPGLSLHGTAQRDLLRYINERLRPCHQVVYTTHSPFMLDPVHIFSVRTVEDVVEKNNNAVEEIRGTKVGERILSRDRDTLLPLQGITGFDIAQTMFVGPYVLVVEGPSEAGYINWFTRQLTKRGREGLDMRWAVCPAEGAPKVSSFVTLFAGRGLTIAAILDYHEGQKRMVDELERSRLLKDGHLLKTTDFVAQRDADIEDIVGWEVMRCLLNTAMEPTGRANLPKAKPKHAPERVAKYLEEYCRTLPPHFPEFHHYLPVDALLSLDQASVDKLDGLPEALDRFEVLFKKLNGLI
ncbi:MAG: AAA family ATPase [Sedimentisphaerales bacterium]|jgi:predicted ATPase|nr:AAA family ATPase [Sedimentisphaerales bacterium]